MDASPPLTLRQRIRYRADNSLTRGVFTVIVWIGLALAGVVLLVAGIVWLSGLGPSDRPVPFPEAVWISLTRSLDAGTVGPDEGGRFRLAGIFVTIAGLLAVALVIGLVTSAVERRVFELRRGRSLVAEQGHILILGFSEKLTIVVNEILEATEFPDPRAVVVLTQRDAIEVEDVIRHARDVLGTPGGRRARRRWKRVVVRRGQPGSIPDLMRVRPQDASTVIVLRPSAAGEDADAAAVKATLAVVKAREGLPTIPIITELSDAKTAAALDQACPSNVIAVASTNIVARVAAQTSRAAGLGTVYEELLNFQGVEFYLHDPGPAAEDMTFADTLLASQTCTVVGLHHADGSQDLCPPFDTVLVPGDRLILIAKDDSTISFDPNARDGVLALNIVATPPMPVLQRTLIIGWNRVAPHLAAEIDRQVARGSELHVLTDPSIAESIDRYPAALINQHLVEHFGSTIDREVVSSVLTAEAFDHIVVLCAHQGITPTQSDARTLLTLLHIRSVLNERPSTNARTNVVTEVMESASIDIARVAQPDDFIVSERLVSLLLAQLAMTPELNGVFADIFDAEGAQIALEPPERLGVEVGTHTFEALIRIAAASGVVLIGWQCAGDEASKSTGGVCINPRKDQAVTLGADDTLVAIVHH